MPRIYRLGSFLVALSLIASSFGQTKAKKAEEEGETLPTIARKAHGLEAMPGFFKIFWDEKEGKVWLQIDKFDSEFLYVNSLATGVGSNDIGLDRGLFGDVDGNNPPEHVVKFVRVGPKVLLVQQNLAFRARTENPDERAAVEEAFAKSTLWGFKVEAEEGGSVLVDATRFLLNDAEGVADKLKDTKQGEYKLDEGRSAIFLPRTKSFPKNTEFEATLTFVGEPKGDWLRSVTPMPKAVTVREHHSFVELPDDQYQPRVFDPRCGFYPVSFADYATPIDQPLIKRFITRHRLRKKNPVAVMSEPVEPILYYVDRGMPEPIKSAVIEGASWWNQAFTSAGYIDAFQVKELPADADPMDLRYNMIEWVHRSTRGWSYGTSVIDPRTGEILKGHVSLGSLRVRQDFLIAQGLMQTYAKGTTADPRALKLALARLRQLAAHEVGHTLGLQHNFAASTQDRASVMDYPPPLVTVDKRGNLNFDQAYATGIGAWDKRTILYGYEDFAPGTREEAGLASILKWNLTKGFRYITDADARPPGGAHPLAHLWDNGASPVDELNRLIRVRAIALSRFDEKNIPPGAPMATLENVLVPVYLAHRYQAEAVVKWIGGVNYSYAARGDGEVTNEPLPTDQQRAALKAFLETLDPSFLALPDNVIALIPPQPPGYQRDRELFDPHTGPIFDPMAAAESWVNKALDLLFDPARLSRVVEQNARGKSQLTENEIFDAALQIAAPNPRLGSYERELARMLEKQCLNHLLQLALNPNTQQQVNALALQKIAELEARWKARPVADESEAAENAYLLFQIDQFRRNPKQLEFPRPAKLPEGPPIGEGE